MTEFLIHYNTEFEQALFLSGDSNILGHWDPLKAKRMIWTEGNIWKIQIEIHSFQYKYFIADYNQPLRQIWEKGPNRRIANDHLKKKIIDYWNYREIEFQCNNPQNYTINITGTTFSLGNFTKFNKMKQNQENAIYNFQFDPCIDKEIKFKYEAKFESKCFSNVSLINIQDASMIDKNYKSNILIIKCQQLEKQMEQQRIEEEEKIRIEIEKRQQEQDKQLIEQQGYRIQKTQENLQVITEQLKSQQTIDTKPVQQQIQIIQNEIAKVENNKVITKEQKKYQKAKFQQQLLKNLKQTGEAKPVSIPHMNQNISKENQEVMLFVLKEQLLRDQNRELLITSPQYSEGHDSLVGAYGEDQKCLRLRTNQVDYNKLVNDTKFRDDYILDFKQKVAKQYNISIDEVENFDITKVNAQLPFIIKSKTDIADNPDSIKFLEKTCGGSIDYYNYFVRAQQSGKSFSISNQDFSPQFNRNWKDCPEKEKRGPPGHKYDYYYPTECQGFGLNINKYGENKDWLAMDGNPKEWRILYHGTTQQALTSIIKTNIKPGTGQAYKKDVGEGIYFTNQIITARGFTHGGIQIGNKRFNLYIQSRCRPEAVKQNQMMELLGYFVVNKSEDVRPYRILLEEV